MNLRKNTFLRAHARLWIVALTALWHHRYAVLVATFALRLPWNLLMSVVDEFAGDIGGTGFPASMLLETLFEPLYAALIFVILSATESLNLASIAGRVIWLAPRLFLVSLKIAFIGLVVPYSVLHIGAGTVLTWWPSQAAASTVMAATVVSLVWLVVVFVIYLLAPAVLVAQRESDGWKAATCDGGGVLRNWLTGPGTGWSLSTARRLLRGRLGQAVAVLITGQLVLGLTEIFVLPGQGPIALLVDAGLMVVAAVWWSLVWQLLHVCLITATDERPTR
jgi:hypothetical protein